MRRLLTGYAIGFNRRHGRQGHLFQNRFKSILCQEEPYLLELVRYIHLNPLRAGMVEDLRSLDSYPYCGHSRIMGKIKSDWQDTGYILRWFGKRISKARRDYNQFVSEGVPQGRRPELTGGGLIRSAGGWGKVKALQETGAYQKGDERILGDGDFVESVLRRREKEPREKKVSLDEVLGVVREKTGVGEKEIRSRSQVRKVVKARALYCYLAREKIGLSGAGFMKQLRMTSGAISSLVSREKEYFELVPLRLKATSPPPAFIFFPAYAD